MRPVRLTDVAQRAGVSTASVSRVLNQPERVSARLRQQVEAALKELRYVPNGAARALASQRTRTIGAVVPTLDIAIFAKGIMALEARLHEAGQSLLTASSEYDPAREVELVRALIERGVDGLVLVGGHRPRPLQELLDAAGVPWLDTYSFEPDRPGPCIGIDHRAATYRMTRHLIDLGHRRFALMTSPRAHNARIAARFAGSLEALQDAGLEPPRALQVEVPYSIADGRAGFLALLGSDQPFTALMCTTDVLAVGALAEARAQGVVVPAELSVTGFDDLDLSSHLDPPLTTVSVPAHEIGRRAAEHLLAMIGGRPVPLRVELAANLILRGSTGRAPLHIATEEISHAAV